VTALLAHSHRRAFDDAQDLYADLLEHLELTRVVSNSSMSCGMVTITAPVTGMRSASVSWISPVLPLWHVDDQVVKLGPVCLE
jgi:hypothetical protein